MSLSFLSKKKKCTDGWYNHLISPEHSTGHWSGNACWLILHIIQSNSCHEPWHVLLSAAYWSHWCPEEEASKGELWHHWTWPSQTPGKRYVGCPSGHMGEGEAKWVRDHKIEVGLYCFNVLLNICLSINKQVYCCTHMTVSFSMTNLYYCITKQQWCCHTVGL